MILLYLVLVSKEWSRLVMIQVITWLIQAGILIGIEIWSVVNTLLLIHLALGWIKLYKVGFQRYIPNFRTQKKGFRCGEKKSHEFDLWMINSGNEENFVSDMYQVWRYQQKSPSGMGSMDHSIDLSDEVFIMSSWNLEKGLYWIPSWSSLFF